MTRARCLVAVICSLLPAVAHAGPAYRLVPGTVLTYETSSKTDGTLKMTGNRTVQAWVLSANADGGWHVLLKSDSSYQYADNRGPPDTRTEMMAVDVSPDGRLTNATQAYFTTPADFFPPLPTGDVKAWQADAPMGDTNHFKVAAASGPGQLKIEADAAGPMVDVYGMATHTVHTIDLTRGLLVRSDGEQTQTYAFQTKGTITTELKGIKPVDDATKQKMADESAIYFDALRRFRDAMQAADADPAKLADGRKIMEIAAAKLTDPTFKTAVEKDLKDFDESAGYARTSAAERAKTLNQPSPDWTLKDLDGREHSLTGYRGKVIVLDFWYRGCGWCIRAMPQISQIATDMKDKPVVVLGMNNDAETKDAKFVADRMKLAYPTLLAKEMPEKFGVRGFPTLILIDRDGVVRDTHVGYSPTLRQDVEAKIEKLLK